MPLTDQQLLDLIAFNVLDNQNQLITPAKMRQVLFEMCARIFSASLNGATIQPPLRFDGTTLDIPKADAETDGYLSKEDWAAFMAGGDGLLLGDEDTYVRIWLDEGMPTIKMVYGGLTENPYELTIIPEGIGATNEFGSCAMRGNEVFFENSEMFAAMFEEGVHIFTKVAMPDRTFVKLDFSDKDNPKVHLRDGDGDELQITAKTALGGSSKETLIQYSGTAAVAGTTNETVVVAQAIDASKWKALADYRLNILGQFQSFGTYNAVIKIYLNTTNDLTGSPILLHRSHVLSNNTISGSGGSSIGINKVLWKDGSVLTHENGNDTVNAANVNGDRDSNVVNNIYQKTVTDSSFNPAVTQYLIITTTMSFQSNGVITRIKKIKLVEQ